MKSFLNNNMLCGRYKNKSITYVLDVNRKYLEWAVNNNIKFTTNDDVIKDLKQYFIDHPIVYLNDSDSNLYNCKGCHSQKMKVDKGSYTFCINCYKDYGEKNNLKRY